VSGDGRYVAFYSRSTNLVQDDHNVMRDVYLFDLSTNDMKRLAPDGIDPDGYSYGPAISQLGNRVAFWSYASNLVKGDHNRAADIFLYDLLTEEISRISVGPAGEANGDCGYPAISRDGRCIAFPSEASNLAGGDSNGVSDIFLAEIRF
jgi:Tol biopolymer transport system component